MLKAGYPMTKGHLLGLLGVAGVTEKGKLTAAGHQYALVNKAHKTVQDALTAGQEPDMAVIKKLVGGDMAQEIVGFYKAGGPKKAMTPQEQFTEILLKAGGAGGVVGAKQTILELVKAGVPLDKSMALELAAYHGDGSKNATIAINHAFMMLNKLNESVKADQAAGIDLDPAKYAKLGGKAYAEAIVAHHKGAGAGQATQAAPTPAPAPAAPKVPKKLPADAFGIGNFAINPGDVSFIADQLKLAAASNGGKVTQDHIANMAKTGGYHEGLIQAIHAEMQGNGAEPTLAALKAKYLPTPAAKAKAIPQALTDKLQQLLDKGYNPDDLNVAGLAVDFGVTPQEVKVAIGHAAKVNAAAKAPAPATPTVPTPPKQTAATNALTDADFKSGVYDGPISQSDINWVGKQIKPLVKAGTTLTAQELAKLASPVGLSEKLAAALYAEIQANQAPGVKVSLDQLKAKYLGGDLNAKSPSPAPPPATLVTPKAKEHAPGVAALPSDLSTLTYAGGAHSLGGFGDKHFFTDPNGEKYLFKPALNKGNGSTEPFKAHAEALGQELAGKLFGPAMSVPTTVAELPVNGTKQIGTLQSMVPNHGNLKDHVKWDNMTTDRQEELLAHHVLDWSIGNFDNHGGQFIVSKHGHVVAIDKEQAFRFVLQDPAGSAKMDMHYHPNGQHVHASAEEPITNQMFRAYAQGKSQLDLNKAILPALKKMEAISQDEYVKMVTPFAVAASKKYGGGPSDILMAAVKRKNELREQYREFFTKLEVDRAKAQGKALPADFKFKFADELTGAVAGQVAAAAGAAHPGQAKAAAAKQATAKGKKPWQAAGLKADPVTDDISVIGPQGKQPHYGTVVTKDGDMVEHQNINMRKITVPIMGSGKKAEGYQMEFKLTAPYHAEVAQAFKKAGAGKVDVRFPTGTYDAQGVFHIGHASTGTPPAGTAQRVTMGNVTVDFHHKSTYTDKYGHLHQMNAMEGTVRVEYHGPHADGKKAAAEISAALDKLGMGNVKNDPTPDHDVHYRARVTLRQVNPSLAEDLRNEKDPQKVYEALAQHGITTAQLKNMSKVEVFPGHSTLYDPKAVKEYEKAGAEFLHHGITGTTGTTPQQRVVDLLKGGGILATKHRYKNGIFIEGSSSNSDMQSGGADSVFLTLTTKNRKSNGEGFNGWGPPYILVDHAELGRRDWYARHGDTYGNTDPSKVKSEVGATDFMKHQAKYHNPGNEVMMRAGVPTSSWRGIAVNHTWEKDELLNTLKAAGYTQINGVPLDKFVQVASEPGKVKLSDLAPSQAGVVK